jgi:hypothetical protein
VEPTQDESPSVYDFLYQDSRRVSSLLAQFDSDGVLLSFARKEMFGEGSALGAESQGDIKGSIKIVAVEATSKVTTNTSKNHGGEAARVYDVLWRNSLALLSYLQEHHFLQRDLSSARLGQIVLVSGILKIYDLPLFRIFLEDRDVVNMIIKSVEGKNGKKGGSSGKSGNEVLVHKATINIVKSMPLSVQATLSNDGKTVWSVLNEACLETSASDLFLKYGYKIPGKWNMIGILDAIPGSEKDEVDERREIETAMDIVANLSSLSKKIGRPSSAYGITPLLIFREVGNTHGD